MAGSHSTRSRRSGTDAPRTSPRCSAAAGTARASCGFRSPWRSACRSCPPRTPNCRRRPRHLPAATHGIAAPAGSYCGASASQAAGGAKDSGRNCDGARTSTTARKIGGAPLLLGVEMRGDADLDAVQRRRRLVVAADEMESRRRPGLVAALARAIVQPLDQRVRRLDQPHRRKVDAGKIVRRKAPRRTDGWRGVCCRMSTRR